MSAPGARKLGVFAASARVAAKVFVAASLALLSLGIGQLVALGAPSHWPYGDNGYALSDVYRLFNFSHLALLVVAAIYLGWQRFSWPSIRLFGMAMLLIAVGYFLLGAMIQLDVEIALRGL